MGSGIIFYEYEKREKFEDYDEKADAELGTIKIRRYHFDDESFVHPLHSVRFDPGRPYEIPSSRCYPIIFIVHPIMGSLLLKDPILLDDRVQHCTIHRGGHHQPIE
ncbi:hypothetical protein PIB30_076514 [Stylosanthes scabra]|uniref:Uncharacterized protein n=1 Tax=Stylosanthes scabra TaxID=79078 RepID=A0ABU6SRJ5_9FABA|nr:hypothetical protein [Stylosanthes scabra]